MKYEEIFQAVKNEYGEEVALTVVQLATIHISTNPTYEEIVTEGLYVRNLQNKFNEVLWETPNHIFRVSLKVWEVLYDWELRQTCAGLGGCETKTLKELVSLLDKP